MIMVWATIFLAIIVAFKLQDMIIETIHISSIIT